MRVILGLDAADAGWALIDAMRRPLSHVGVIAGRGRAAAQPHRPQPLVVAGPLTRRKAWAAAAGLAGGWLLRMRDA